MTKNTCTIDGCHTTYYARGYCRPHYKRAWKTGVITDNRHGFHDITGQRFGTLTAIRLIQPDWECLCDCGATIRASKGALSRGDRKTCGNTLIHHRTNNPSYEAMHKRVVKARGKASTYRCVDCGQPAHHWSYNHTEPDQLTSKYGQPYSTDVNKYEPRCRRCHSLLDEAGIRRPRSNRGWVKGPVERVRG